MPRSMAHVEARISTEEGQEMRFFHCDARGDAWLVMPLKTLIPLLFSCRHAVCTAFADWDAEVKVALMDHGHYDPTTNHRVPAGGELDAIEIQSALRELFRATFGHSWEGLWGEKQTPVEP
jgi:hypothetical protein